MTLIYSDIVPKIGLFALSDSITSRPRSSGAPPLVTPLKRDPVQNEEGSDIVSALGQKTVIFGRTMVMYSGWCVVGTSLINTIHEISHCGAIEINLATLLRECGLPESELREVSLIYHYRNDESRISRFHLDAHAVPDRGHQIVGQGSGVYNYFEADIPTPAGSPEHVDHFMRLMYHVNDEICGREHYHYTYGGWFEFAHATADGFRKIPYAIKLWFVDDNGRADSSGPAWFSNYHDYDNIVIRVSSKIVDGKLKREFVPTIIPDLLRRRITPLPDKPIFPYVPELTGHIIVNQRFGHVKILTEDQRERSGLFVRMEEAGFGVKIERSLVDKIEQLDWTE